MSVASIIGRAVPTAAAVSEVRAVPSSRHHKHYEARLSDGSVLLLRLPAPLMVKLLRSERAASVSAEAAVLAWLGSLSDDDNYGDETESGAPRDGNPQLAPGRQHLIGWDGSTEAHRSRGASQPAVTRSDITFAPALAAHSPAHTLAGPEFNVVRPTHGSNLASLSPPLTTVERAAVDFQNGRLLRRLSRMRSPSGRFGPALGVLGGRVRPPSSKRTGVAGAATGSGSAAVWEPAGSSTWAVAFASLLEGVLRDGEDMHVTLPYSSIRQHFWRLRHLLGAVTNACLVVADAGEDENVLVVRKAVSRSALPKKATKRLGGKSSNDGKVEKRVMKRGDREKDPKGKGKSRDGRERNRSGHTASDPGDTDGEASDSGIIYTGTRHDEDIVVTGMRDWSNCIFGDPLFATAFHRNANDHLWSGFTSPPIGDQGPDPIEDEAHAQTRLLLYDCYHTVTRVVREFYRPSKDSSKRELAARKSLNGVIARLDRVPSDRSRRRRRPSGEMSPAKRYKTDEDENDDDNGVFGEDDDT